MAMSMYTPVVNARPIQFSSIDDYVDAYRGLLTTSLLARTFDNMVRRMVIAGTALASGSEELGRLSHAEDDYERDRLVDALDGSQTVMDDASVVISRLGRGELLLVREALFAIHLQMALDCVRLTDEIESAVDIVAGHAALDHAGNDDLARLQVYAVRELLGTRSPWGWEAEAEARSRRSWQAAVDEVQREAISRILSLLSSIELKRWERDMPEFGCLSKADWP